MKKITLLAIVAIAIVSCGPKIYKSDQFSSALVKHKTVAILPAEVTMKLRPNEAKKLNAEQMSDLASKTAYDIQDKMYGWFLRRGDRFDYTVTFQDINKTNARLKDAKITYDDLKNQDRATLAKALGVDAVMQGKIV